jgi:hypothetical protein
LGNIGDVGINANYLSLLSVSVIVPPYSVNRNSEKEIRRNKGGERLEDNKNK